MPPTLAAIITPELIIAITGLISVIGAFFQRRRSRLRRERESERPDPYDRDDDYYDYLENPSVPPSARQRRKRTNRQ